MLHGDVAVFVGRGSAKQRNIDGEGLVTKPLLTIDHDELDQVLFGAGALPSAALSWIDECVETNLGDESGPSAGNVARDLRKNALRQRVRLNPVLECHRDHHG